MTFIINQQGQAYQKDLGRARRRRGDDEEYDRTRHGRCHNSELMQTKTMNLDKFSIRDLPTGAAALIGLVLLFSCSRQGSLCRCRIVRRRRIGTRRSENRL
jgi:hypothetical protein